MFIVNFPMGVNCVLKKIYLSVQCLLCLFLVLVPIAQARGGSAETGKKFPWEGKSFSSPASELFAEAKSVSVSENAKAIILIDEGSFSFDEDGRCLRRYRMVYRILTEAGLEEWASISAGWSPWYEERPILRARVITPDGVEHTLAPENISDAPMKEYSQNVYSDRRVVRAPLPALMIGAVVEREICIREKDPLFSAGSVENFYFGNTVRTLKTRLTIDAPAVLALNYVISLLPDLPVQ